MLEGFYWDMVNQVSNFGKGIMSFVPIKGRFQIFLVKKGKHFVCDMRDETRCGGIVVKLALYQSDAILEYHPREIRKNSSTNGQLID